MPLYAGTSVVRCLSVFVLACLSADGWVSGHKVEVMVVM